MRLDGVGKRYGFRRPRVVRDVSLELTFGMLAVAGYAESAAVAF